MANELAFILINPYTISKSRTGGVIARLISRSGLELVGARMFGPSRALVEQYAELVRTDPESDEESRNILADYILRSYAPDPNNGLRRRVLMLVFEGHNAVATISRAVGRVRSAGGSAETVRDTYGDFILDEQGAVRYVEPAVLMGPTPKAAAAGLKLWAEFSARDGGLIEDTVDLARGQAHQKTLVLIKPDNFRFPSARPGNIIDLFSGSGLRIIGAKVLRMSLAEAEEFYGPVRSVLREKLRAVVAERAARALAAELGFPLAPETAEQLGTLLGPLYGDHQFFQIIQFMTGCWLPDVPPAERAHPGKERCLALVYAGPKAVEKIRGILGPTDPRKAHPGSVRREFGQDIMVNAAHASDSPENAAREMKIVKVDQDNIRGLLRPAAP